MKIFSKTWFALTGVVIISAFAGLWVYQFLRTPEVSANVAQQLQQTAFLDSTGKTRYLNEFKGEAVIVNFWATWCAPCIEEIPELDRFYQKNASNKVHVVGIAIDTQSAVAKFLKQQKISYPIFISGMEGIDLVKGLGNTFQVLPYSLLLDRNGTVVDQHIGMLNGQHLQKWLSKVAINKVSG